MIDALLNWLHATFPFTLGVARLLAIIPVVIGAAWLHELTHFVVARRRGYDPVFGAWGLSVFYDLDPDEPHIDHVLIGAAPQALGIGVLVVFMLFGMLTPPFSYTAFLVLLAWTIFTLNGQDDVKPAIEWLNRYRKHSVKQWHALPRWRQNIHITTWLLGYSALLQSFIHVPITAVYGIGAIPAAYFLAAAAYRWMQETERTDRPAVAD